MRKAHWTRKSWLPLSCAAVVAMFLALLGGGYRAAPAEAQTGPPTLTGEQLVAVDQQDANPPFCFSAGSGVVLCIPERVGTVDVQASCNPDRSGTASYTVSGAALGPYPGTYTESGTITLGAPLPTNPFFNRVETLQATFTIDSPVGRVTGTKTLRADRPSNSPVSAGSCENVGRLIFFLVRDASYEARIQTAAGEYVDRGFTSLRLDSVNRPSSPDPVQGFFYEEYRSRLSTPEPVGAAEVVLTPPAALNNVGTSHTVTATATTSSATPAAQVRILFTVSGSVDAQGSCTTNAQGQCDFTYTGPDFPGADAITGCADNNKNNQVDAGEPCGEAAKIWLLPATTPGQVTGGGWIFRPGDGSRVSFGFNAKSDGDAVKGNCNVIDHATKTHIRCLTVDTLVVTGTHATLFGQATVSGTATNYRIDVDDHGEPGTLDTFKFQTDSGYTATGVLAGGNVQIHKQELVQTP